MKECLRRFSVVGLFASLVAGPAWCQKGGGSGSGGAGGTQPSPQPIGTVFNPSPPASNQPQSPQFINGRVLMENGQPVPEAVSVALVCGSQMVQVVQSDLKGQFQLALGTYRPNSDFSADNNATINAYGGPNNSQGALADQQSSNPKLMGCELQLSVSGYLPLEKVISDPGSLGMVEVGTLVLQRIANVQGSAISVTSLMVPGNARKEFEKGETAGGNHQLKSAEEHFQRAIALYGKYAAAWNDLGQVQLALNQPDDAHRDFENAIAADSHYIPPYVNLAGLELRQENYERAADTAKKALVEDPNVETASFIETAADFKLQRFDEAEKCGRDAEEKPHRNIPQIHALLAEIYLERQDYPSAAAQMRAYLKESPEGQFAEKARQTLAQIKSTPGQGGDKQASTAP